ncbi:MAG: GDP-L-fucose synthase [Solirubrobacterales bacterium]
MSDAQPTSDFFSGRRVVVTGGAGFLGGYICGRLEELGAELFIPRSTEYDLTTEGAVVRMYADAKPEIVIHLAARVGGIGANRKNPGAYWYDNLMMGSLLLEHGRRAEIEKFVQLGTICSYPKFSPIPFEERNLWDGYPEETNAPYGVAKKALLAGIQGYREQYGLNGIFVMPVNLYGPRDNFDLANSHVIPALIRKMIEARESGTSVELWGDGSPTREFLFVEDCARAILLATERLESSEPVNIGAGFEISIKDLAELIATAVGFEGEVVWNTEKPGGQPRRKLDTRRAKELFGFEAEVGFEDGIKRTAKWFDENREWVNRDVHARAEADARANARG